MSLKTIQSERVIVTTKIGANTYKLFQIIFSKKDGSIFINFPYYKNTKGLISKVNFPGNTKIPADLSLVPGGKVTSHMVKYAHHPDGRVHFSQDGKIYTKILKKAVPINEINGHFFTFQIQGLDHFKCDNTNKKNNIKKTKLVFKLGETEPPAIKAVGHIYSYNLLLNNTEGDVKGPIAHFHTPDGKTGLSFLISSPFNQLRDKILAIFLEEIPLLDKQNTTALTFIGGFDKPEIVNNIQIDTSFLALSYPAENYDDLKTTIGSVDFER